ncbi:hypothetical protein D9757_005137 [Collybiopsis confluens]|uniref:Uncharacterized protein n=1 Tax=Collybiopsis confluens TaxID=2823264 RepID=A0A8H5HT06_9AGAR|nr:hypothetical protein D9757_005137 [Collybiopsis confluens]
MLDAVPPLFTSEPSLVAMAGSPTDITNHPLFSSFIKIQSSKAGFTVDDLELNQIFLSDSTHGQDVDDRVKHIWRELGQKRTHLREIRDSFDAGYWDTASNILENLFISDTNLEHQIFPSIVGGVIQMQKDGEYRHYTRIANKEERMGVLTPALTGPPLTDRWLFRVAIYRFVDAVMKKFQVLDQIVPIHKLVKFSLDDQTARSYNPRSNMGIWYRDTWPGAFFELQFGEESSDQQVDDHVRMLLQGGAIVRMLNIALRPPDAVTYSGAVLPLIYASKAWKHATMYLLFQSGYKIFYLKRSYNLQADVTERLRFARDGYNILDHIWKSVPSEDQRKKLASLRSLLQRIPTDQTIDDDERNQSRARSPLSVEYDSDEYIPEME